ncbi:DUF2201 family putative metallopeptidase [Nocardiopsis composta]|uniref:Putative metal-dependent peptidase n=1 Tax=Nocardiopsis composta TaxID=157465 RepID=A0A7W8QT95_9ACTN|nr:hypothetical protein [Nocardiopsis composta]MBB5435528.1 putative metal-dependent peptidase [Nocardiopsis composta]
MSRGGKRGKGKRPDPAREAFLQGAAAAAAHPVLSAIEVRYCAEDCTHVEPGGMAVVDSGGTVHVDASRRAEPAEWTWAVAHCVLHLGFGHVPAAAGEREQPDPALVAARCTAVARFQATLGGTGTPPGHVPLAFPGSDEESLAARWRRDGVPEGYTRCGTGGPGPDHRLVPWQGFRTPPDWQRAFAHGLTRTMAVAMERAGGRPQGPDGRLRDRRPWERALDWFISSYPLLGGIAAGMELVADADLARAHGIAIAAVDASAGEIYINPFAPHTDEEWRFILAHEMLHAALRHGDRRGPRDPYLFNVAADYVINGWLREMGVGDMPNGALHDPRLAGLSAEEVYDRIATDMRRARRLSTLRGKGAGDVLGEPLPRPPKDYVDLDEFYRRGLARGMELHDRGERGLLPAGLVEEIRALAHPPPPWDVRLARWFDEFVPRPQAVRSYARPSRRQASTPDIPRAGRYFPPEEVARCTFGVVLDTSGSMDARLLGKALGAIASYAAARDVPAARVVFCDAAPYDAGYLAPAEIAGRVRVRGRGGTVLQPGIDLLHRADDFPRTAPLLVITDGRCDTLRVRREHAYLLPRGGRLPFRAAGPVFEVH